METLQAHGVPAGVVQDHGDLIDRDPQMRHRGFYVQMEHAEMGLVHHEALPYRFSETPWQITRPAPIGGQHTDLVLQEVLGMSEDEVNQCVVDGAVMA
jgi:benzylsuccinate CoA-transferase BbsF subunit